MRCLPRSRAFACTLLFFALLCCSLLPFPSLAAVVSSGASPLPDHSLATWHLDPPSAPADTSEGPCARGVDLSSHAFVEDFLCLQQLGYHFVVVRAWQSDCTLDPTALETIENAAKAGMQEVHVYLYPSAKCLMSASEQVDATFAVINSTLFTRAWWDVEPRGSGWSVDVKANEQYVRSALDAMARAIGTERVGVYSSFFGWPAVVGHSTSGWSQYKLWFADPSDEPAFLAHHMAGGMGGWPRGGAFMKQYKDQEKVCGLVVGLNSRQGENAQCLDQQQIAGLAPMPTYHPPRSMREAQPQPHSERVDQPRQQQQRISADANGGIEFVDEQQQSPPPPAAAAPPPASQDQWLVPSYEENGQPKTTGPAAVQMEAYVPAATPQAMTKAAGLRRKAVQWQDVQTR